MTAIRNAIKPTRRPGELGVHSVDRFHFAVPDLAIAKTFYGEFGLDLEEDGDLIAMKTRGNPHVWVTIGEGPRKKLGHLSFGAFEEDFDRFAERLQSLGVKRLDPPPGVKTNGLWFHDHDGNLVEIKVAAKSSPNEKSEFSELAVGPGERGAPFRRDVARSQSQTPRTRAPVHARRREGGSVLYPHAGPAPFRPVRRRHRFSARDSRQRPSHGRLLEIERARPSPSELGRGLDRRYRPRRHAHAGEGILKGMGPRTACPRLQFLPLCRRSVGVFQRIFRRHRLCAGGSRLEHRRSRPGGIPSTSGARTRRTISPTMPKRKHSLSPWERVG